MLDEPLKTKDTRDSPKLAIHRIRWVSKIIFMAACALSKVISKLRLFQISKKSGASPEALWGHPDPVLVFFCPKT